MNSKIETLEKESVRFRTPIIKLIVLIIGITVASVITFILPSCTSENKNENIIPLSQEEMIARYCEQDRPNVF